MGAGLDGLLPGAVASSEAIGLATALGLVVVLALLLPRESRRSLRQPVLLLGAHLVLQALLAVLPADAGGRKVLSFASLVFLLAAIGRAAVLLVLEAVLGRRLARRPPRIVSDILVGVVYTGVLLTALRDAGVEPGSILTTSALLTAAIALSLQETLGNVVAGLAIQVQRPFDVDDWIQFDSELKHIGKVLEINWRATKVLTLDQVEVIVPNATLAKAAITTFTKPTPTSRRNLYVQVPADVPPGDVHRSILDALPGSFGLLADPPPSVVTNQFVDGNVEYWVRFFTDEFHKRDIVDGAARDRIWYALSRRGIRVAPPNRAVAMREVSVESVAHEEASRTSLREQLLRHVDFLGALSDEQRRSLAQKTSLRLYAPGEALVRQGEPGEEMFIVQEGEVVVVREHGPSAEETELARLGPGKFFGEMALMAGEGRTATVRALVACSILVIGRDALRGLLESAPDLAENISRVIGERQAATSEADAPPSMLRAAREERSSLLLGRIRRFFSL
jgi:small-conductance mechanosensitive channel/CRP-like cAMP-binding protein